MRGLKFGEYHTANDWNLIQEKKELSVPEPKTIYLDIDGRNGSIDLSESLTNDIKYKDRTLSCTYILIGGTCSQRIVSIDSIINTIHGKRLNIIDDDFPNYYLVGRVTVKSYENNKSYSKLSIEAKCEPYMYSLTDEGDTI